MHNFGEEKLDPSSFNEKFLEKYISIYIEKM